MPIIPGVVLNTIRVRGCSRGAVDVKNDMLDRWKALWVRLGSAKNMEPLFRKLLDAYGEQQRAYHDFSHIRRCLEEFDVVKNRLGHPDEVEVAIWFHDIIYDPLSSRNEEDSANIAAAELKKAKISNASILMIKDLILATRHNGIVKGSDAQYLMDIDIATLGSTPAIYQQYEKNIRKEYMGVSDSMYRQKRKELLEAFLKNDRIYRTNFFRSKYAEKAKRNLEAAIKALSEGAEIN
jgi:predicted metal-dependent HD superfamily phosphohydrolase